jgi:hypothetical protein
MLIGTYREGRDRAVQSPAQNEDQPASVQVKQPAPVNILTALAENKSIAKSGNDATKPGYGAPKPAGVSAEPAPRNLRALTLVRGQKRATILRLSSLVHKFGNVFI